jgi:hypothetical protein
LKPDGVAPPPGSVAELVTRLTSDEHGWRWALQSAIDENVVFDNADLIDELRRALDNVMNAPSPSAQIRATVLVRIVRLRNVASAADLLRDMLSAPRLTEDLRYEMARALSAVAAVPEHLMALLESKSDAVVAGVVDEIGDSEAPKIAPSIRRLLRELAAHQATRTGDALARLQLLNEYKEFWQTHQASNARIDFLLNRVGEMFTPIPPPSPPIRSDNLAGRWLRARLHEIEAADADTLKRRIKALIDSSPPQLDYLQLIGSELE